MLFLCVLAWLGHPSLAASSSGTPEDLPTLHQHLLSSYLITTNTSGADAQSELYLSSLLPDGSFSDLNYSDPSVFTPWVHALRFSAMGSVVMTPACAHFQSPALLAGTLSAFSWFLKTRPVSGNWWHNQIGCPLPVSQLTLQFTAKLSPEQYSNASDILAASTWESFSRTGTNAVDIGKVRIARGVLESNLTMVAEAFGVIWGTFKPSNSLPPASPEGPKTDGSFMQHGPQLYNGNYGVSWGNSGLELVVLGVNTSFAATNSSYAILATVYLNGCRRMIHRASLQWDMAVVGRQSASPNAQAATGVPVSAVNPGLMRAVGGPRGAEFQAFARDVEFPGEAVAPPSFVVFYTSDYAVFTRRNYTASVRMTGARVGGGECINGQGTKSLHAADGVTYLYQHGFEYKDIGPTWDWQRLPGTTVQVNGTQLNCSTADSQGVLPNVGGVTDGLQGVAWMDFQAASHGQDLVARKTTFFLDAALLSFGSAIASSNPTSRVTTTVESCLLMGGVWAGRAGAGPLQVLPQGSHTLPPPTGSSPLLLWHSGVGYVLLPSPTSAAAAAAAAAAAPAPPPPGSFVYVLNEDVTGSWAALGGPPEPANVTQGMFTLGMDHGNPPVSNADYAYARLPGLSLAAFEAGWATALAAAPTVSANAGHAAVYDTASGRLFASVFDNTSALTVPPPMKGLTTVKFPLVGGFILATYLNASTGNMTLAVNATFPATQNLHAELGHPGEDHFIVTDATFLPCENPHCPATPFCRSKHDCDAGWNYDCFQNGTIHFVNPPSQGSFVDGIVPPLLCTLAG